MEDGNKSSDDLHNYNSHHDYNCDCKDCIRRFETLAARAR